MSFLYPSLLWALSLIAIPIIIHFFNFRTHKTVYFSNVAFLKDIEQENKSRNTLKDLLILLFRILAIVSLVLAFANPVKNNLTESQNSDCTSEYGIFLDNSFSMNGLSSDGKNLDLAKTKAADILKAMPQNAKCFFLDNQLSSQQQHSYISDIVSDFIASTQNSAKTRTFNELITRFNYLFENETNPCKHNIFIISDFQKTFFDKNNFLKDTNNQIYLLPIESVETDNLFIDTAWFISPYHLYNSADSLTIRIINNSAQNYTDRQIKLSINDTLKTLSTFNITPNSQKDITLYFTNTEQGFINGKIEIDDYPITYDNSLFFNYYIAPKIKVLLINGKSNSYLTKFYNDNKYFDLTEAEATNIPISDFPNFQSIIFSTVQQISQGVLNELKNYIATGGIVTFIPSEDASTENFNEIMNFFDMPNITNKVNLEVEINQINEKDKIYLNTFEKIKVNTQMPTTKAYFKINKGHLSNYTTLLSAENDDKILIYKDIDLGALYVFTNDLQFTNCDFMTNPISVPTFYNISIFTKNNNKIYHTINDSKIELNNINFKENLKIKNIQTNIEFIPPISNAGKNKILLDFQNIQLDAGNYRIYENNEQIGNLSFNYDRNESDLTHYTTEELSDIIEKNNLKNWQILSKKGLILQEKIISSRKNNDLWKLFVILSLVFIFFEVLTIRIIKN